MTKSQAYALQEHRHLLIENEGEINLKDYCSGYREFVLEIGFGMGEALLECARMHPEKAFIGVEVHRPGVGAVLANCVKQNITNVRVICDDVVAVLPRLEDHLFEKVQIFYPDPWHKTRHHKRRLISENFLNQLNEKLCVDGILHVATDWENYADSIIATIKNNPHFELCNDMISKQLARSRPQTRFQHRGSRLGHQHWDVVAKKR